MTRGIQHVTGWYDSWGTQVANVNYVELRKAKRSLQRLIIGPWTHGGQTGSYAGDAQFSDDAALDSIPSGASADTPGR